MTLTTSILKFNELLALRQTVFIIEQQCFYQDIDNQDQNAIHIDNIPHIKMIKKP